MGYCRKSKTTRGRDEVVKSLQNMIIGLKSRPLVEQKRFEKEYDNRRVIRSEW